jgi:hypothetical protein
MAHIEPPKTIYVQGQRKDGKYKVTYVFPVSGVRMSKIRTKEQILAERANDYQIIGVGF